MLINGIDSSALGVILHNRIITNNKIATKQKWIEGSIQPSYIRQQESFKDITLEFLITEQNEEDAFIIMSNLTMLLKKAVIIFDDMPDLQFDVTLSGKTQQQRLKNGNFIYTAKLSSDYAKSQTEIFTTNSAATDSFILNLIYYKDNTKLLATESITINSSSFYDKEEITFADLGIVLNKYQQQYYNGGQVSNFFGRALTYDNLKEVGTLIINYSPIVYYKDVVYYLGNGTEFTQVETVSVSFTHQQIEEMSNIGQLINLNRNRPNGYKAEVKFNEEFTFDNIVNFPIAIPVYYSKVEDDKVKDITINYIKEIDNNGTEIINSRVVPIAESSVVEGTTIVSLINLDAEKPEKYYNNGYCIEVENSELLTFDTLLDTYTIKYDLTENEFFVEYYNGVYPNWVRTHVDTYKIKYQSSYDNAENLFEAIGINLNKYKTDYFENGEIFNNSLYSDYDNLIATAVAQIFYTPKEYNLVVNYIQDNDNEQTQVGTRTYTLTAMQFVAEPPLSAIININEYRAEGYKYDEDSSYRGEVSLSALVAASPISIVYVPVQTLRTRSVVVKYLKQMANTFSTIQTSILTVEEAEIGGGVYLKNLIDLNKYRPEYYDSGIFNGSSPDTIVTFDDINGTYEIYYYASTYTTQVRYYTDDVAVDNWVGSDSIHYTILDFDANTTLVSLGLNINQFQPPYSEAGEIQPIGGAVTFATLRNLAAINIVYMSNSEPDDGTGIDYPHRILYLPYNDYRPLEGIPVERHLTNVAYISSTIEGGFPHAYINTGFIPLNIDKTTIIVDTYFTHPYLFAINPQYSYLFGATSGSGSMYLGYWNPKYPFDNTHGKDCYYIAKAGGPGVGETHIVDPSPEQNPAPSGDEFSKNTGIYASPSNPGTSNLTLTHTRRIVSDSSTTGCPIYLYGLDNRGQMEGGIAGVGIKSCKIYYDGVLIRDFIPVQYYDLIGDKVAPSNCLYDKVTQNFFEDATGKDNFKIMDDPEYQDTNPLHKIGKFTVNYYKEGGFFQSRVIYFRENELINNSFDLDNALAIDQYQPRFYGTGNADWYPTRLTYNNLNNAVFEVNYPRTGYYITMNYYKDTINQSNFLGSDRIYLTEDMFYRVPTFGQLFDLLKYKPEGYKLEQQNIPYTQNKVTLERILQSQPYDVVYTECPNPKTYNFKVKYYKHKNVIDPKHPLNQYDLIADPVYTVDETQIIDGVYPEKFMNFNAYKPQGEESYWQDGQPFEWYIEDENLLTPEDLRKEYIITYEPTIQSIDIKYYTDEVDENDFNLVASDTWNIRINDWGFGEEFQIVDELPNSYINKYKPANCESGLLQNPEQWYTFDSLVKQGHLDILYMTKVEPHDPDDDSFPEKVLLWRMRSYQISELVGVTSYHPGSGSSHDWMMHNGAGHLSGTFRTLNNKQMDSDLASLCIPYINLGYTPKEIGRLAIQTKAYSLADSCWSGFGQKYAPVTDAYTYFLGYMGAPTSQDIINSIGYDNAQDACFGFYGYGKSYNVWSHYSPKSSGWLAFRGHIPFATGYSKQFNSIHDVDGHNGWEWSNEGQIFHRTNEAYYETVKTLLGGYRLGAYKGVDENLNEYVENDDHIIKWEKRNSQSKFFKDLTVDNFNNCSHEAISFPNAKELYWWSATAYDWQLDEWTDHPLPPYDKEIVTLVEQEGKTDEIYPLAYMKYTYPATIFHPTTMMIDAFHNFIEVYDMSNDQHPSYYNIDTSKDYDLFVDRCKPKGPIRLFTTTNPDTGKPNIITSRPDVFGWVKNYRTKISTTTSSSSQEEGEGEEGENQNQPGTTAPSSDYESHGGLLDMAYNPYTTAGINCPWIDFRFTATPGILRTAIWSIKIWDRGRLVRDMIPVHEGDQIFDYVAPFNGLFDKVTEIFFGVENKGGDIYYNYLTGEYSLVSFNEKPESGSQFQFQIAPQDVWPLEVWDDPTSYGKFIINYYDYDNTWLGNKWVRVPVDYFPENIEFKDLLAYNDFKPSDYYHDGMLDTDTWLETDIPKRSRLLEMYDAGSVNIYYKQKQYTKTIVYYNENTRIASKDFFFSQHEIEEANTLADLGIDPELYRTDEFGPGIVMSDETIIASDDVAAFIDAPSPVVVYHKYTKEERPDLLYVEYYRGGAYEPEGEESIVLNSENKNYLDCDLSAVVLNPKGLIKYVNHYHSALYEDEEMPYFIAYQVDVNANYVPIHKGPARAYTLLAHITDRGRYTIIEERNGWGRLKEYPKGWILLDYTKPIVGPGQNPDYDIPTIANVTIPFGTRLSITKMTIDRLWAYTPEYDSWIKTEEISFDQQGRLYSALSMRVFHLDQIDWNNVNELSDVIGDIQQYKPRFHDNSNFELAVVTQETLSNLHSIDIIYPETIYTYVVKYYKDTLSEDNVIGRGGFSCSVSDWNPDWDTFLSTSWLTGMDAKATSNITFHRVVGKTETLTIPKNDEFVIINSSTYEGENSYYILWNGYLGYINKTYVDIFNGKVRTVTPVLYRAEPLMLTWDFYNLDLNLYKPDFTYKDGIPVWNPHTYNNKIFNFSFEELIGTGSQKILYVPDVDVNYKAVFTRGFMRLPVGIHDFYLLPDDTHAGVWDIEVKYKENTYGSYSASGNAGYLASYILGNTALLITGETLYTTPLYIDSNGAHGYQNRQYIQPGLGIWNGNYANDTAINNRLARIGTNKYSHTYYNYKYQDGSILNSYYNIVNMSNKRPWNKAIVGIYGKDNWESNPSFYSRSRVILGDDTSKDYEPFEPLDMPYINIGAGAPGHEWHSNTDSYTYDIESVATEHTIWYVKVWHNYELIHYYTPMPQGYWMPNGEQAPTDGFYDLITCNFINQKSLARNNYQQPAEFGVNNLPVIKKADSNSSYSYFDNWVFDIQNVNYTINIKEDTTIYRYPDILSAAIGTVEKNTIIPISKMTEDSEHHVIGTWYNINSGWIKTENCELINNLSEGEFCDKLIAFKDNDNNPTPYYGFIRPEAEVPEFLPADYITLTKATESIKLPYFTSDINKVVLEVSGKLAPVTSGSYGYGEDETFGYIFGNRWFGIRCNILHASTATEDVKYTVEAIRVNETQFDIYVNGTKSITSTIKVADENASKASSSRYSLRIGAPEFKNQYSKYMAGQANVRYHRVQIYDRNDNLVEDITPILRYNKNEKQYKLYFGYLGLEDKNHRVGAPGWNDSYSKGNIFSGDYSAANDIIIPEGKLNSFTTERLSRVYYSTEDFYWNGIVWVPKSYTEDNHNIEEAKTYIVSVGNVYSYKYPLDQTGYIKDNYLLGDRISVIGYLVKNPRWYLLSDKSWIYNNNNELLTQLEE